MGHLLGKAAKNFCVASGVRSNRQQQGIRIIQCFLLEKDRFKGFYGV